MEKATVEKIQVWIKSSIKLMLAKNDGAVYYYHIKGGISFVLAWIPCDTEEKNKYSNGIDTVEASVRKSDSSYFVEDWSYIGEGLTLDTKNENNDFKDVVDCIFKIACNYVKTEIYYVLPNNEQIELISEMHIANCDFGDFEEPIEDIRKAYYETTDEVQREVIDKKIEAQCYAFASFLGDQDEEIQSMIGIDDLSIGIKQTLII